MNFPSTLGGNWAWRMTEDQLTPAVEQELLDFTSVYRRENTDLVKEEAKKAENNLSLSNQNTRRHLTMESLQKYVIDHHQKQLQNVQTKNCTFAFA